MMWVPMQEHIIMFSTLLLEWFSIFLRYLHTHAADKMLFIADTHTHVLAKCWWVSKIGTIWYNIKQRMQQTHSHHLQRMFVAFMFTLVAAWKPHVLNQISIDRMIRYVLLFVFSLPVSLEILVFLFPSLVYFRNGLVQPIIRFVLHLQSAWSPTLSHTHTQKQGG